MMTERCPDIPTQALHDATTLAFGANPYEDISAVLPLPREEIDERLRGSSIRLKQGYDPKAAASVKVWDILTVVEEDGAPLGQRWVYAWWEDSPVCVEFNTHTGQVGIVGASEEEGPVDGPSKLMQALKAVMD
ncbi:MAG TPA: hypothetical protein VHD60_03055 [Candidatus Saccharimonadales bacterium]|nr:hypothetical protein [Candidatus Saccharimonadales bacterium]